MITDEEVFVVGTMLEDKGMSHSDIDAYFLEHHGVKGMRWGVRSVKAIGRGVKKTAKFANRHRKGTAAVLAGSAFTAALLTRKEKVPVKSLSTAPFRAAGKNWVVEAQSGEAFDTFFKTLRESGRTLG